MVGVFLIVGCGDKAQADYAKCVQLDTSGDLAGAVAACSAAIGADPNSQSGKAAADKIASINGKLAAKEKADTDAKAAAQALAAAQAAAQARASAAAQAPAVPAAEDPPTAPSGAGPCSSIQLSPVHAAIFSIVSASGGDDSCEIIIQAKRPIPRLSLDWVNYDKDGVKVGQHIDIIRGLGAGEKAKETLRLSDGTVKIVSKPR